MGIKYSIQLTFMECLLWACCWVRLINISWTRLIFGEMKHWLLLFVPSVILPFNVYWMDTIARIIHTFSTFVCVGVCLCVRAHTCLHSTLPCVAAPVLAFCYFICRVRMPQPGFCHVQLYFFLLVNTSPLQARTWTQCPSILTARSCSLPSPRFPFIHSLVHPFHK